MMGNPKIPYLSVAVLMIENPANNRVQPLSTAQWRDKLLESLVDESIPFSGHDFAEVITLSDLEDVFESLSAEGLLKRYDDPNTSTYWEIKNVPALEYLKVEMADYSEKYVKLGDNWLFEALRNLTNQEDITDTEENGSGPDREVSVEVPAEAASAWGSSWGGAPASDRVVPLNHNAPDYKEAFSALEKVIKEFREDHPFGNNPPPERDRVLDELEAGRKLLKGEDARPSALRELLQHPLEWIAEKFAEETIGQLAKKAAAALLKFLAGLITNA